MPLTLGVIPSPDDPTTMLDFGVNYEEFMTRYFERQPFVRSGALTTPLMAWHDLDALLHSLEPDERLLQLFRNGPIPQDQYVDSGIELGRPRSRLNKQRFYALLQAGATLVLNQFENHALPAQQLCAAVGGFTSHSTTSNAYVSFSGDGTFGKHWDTHDVFAIQLIGKKRWRLFAPTLPLPMSHQTSTASGHTCSENATLDCVLNTGDMLYIPRGWWHQVTPLDEGSLHVSVGTYPPTMFDYLMWACSRQLPSLLAARRSFTNANSARAVLPEIMQVLGEAAMSQQLLETFRLEVGRRVRQYDEFNIAEIQSRVARPQ